jgi:hypothetical protein
VRIGTVEVNRGTLEQTNRQNRLSAALEELLKTFCNLVGYHFRVTVTNLFTFAAKINHNRI